jgi:hypothetical protein
MPKAAGFDPDAQAFITAAAITNPTQQNAINTLVVDLKGYSIWTKFKAIYPIVGGSASSHKFNLKDPRDLDAAFRLTFTNSWTHSATGMTPSVAWANTFLTPSTSLSLNSTHISYYSRTASTSEAYDMGSYQFLVTTTGMLINFNNQFYGANNDGAYNPVASTGSQGLYISSRTSSNVKKGYKNSTIIQNVSTASVALPNIPVYLGAFSGIAAYGNKQCAFASIGDGLTDTEAANFYTAVQTFQTTLGRQV